MRISLRKSKNAIPVADLTDRHLIVGIIQGHPCIVTKGYYEGKDRYSFKSLNNGFTKGNGYAANTGSGAELQPMIRHYLKAKAKVAAFHEFDFREALMWLFNNALPRNREHEEMLLSFRAQHNLQ